MNAVLLSTGFCANNSSCLPPTICRLNAMYVFKTNAEVRECFLDIIFAGCGIYWSPLFFTFHLFKLLKTPGALIVVTSLTHNVGRLSVTLLLCLLFTWVSAVSGWLFFMRYHVEDSVDNDGGPCANLLTCFFSYSYAGLMQSGVGGYITGLKFPVTGIDLLHSDFYKILCTHSTCSAHAVRRCRKIQS